MSSSLARPTLVLALALVAALTASASGGPAHAADPEPRLAFHHDRAAGVTQVVVADGAGDVVDVSWPGALPIGVSPGGDRVYVPVGLVLRLLDALDGVSTSRAAAASAWLVEGLGAHAGTRDATANPEAIVGFRRSLEHAEWCGERLDANQRCPNDCISVHGPINCKGCGCRGFN